MKLQDDQYSIISSLNEFDSREDLEAAIIKVLSRQEKIFKLLFTTKDDSRIKKGIKSFLNTVDEIHKQVLEILKVEDFHPDIGLYNLPDIMYVANRPQFFVIDILEKFAEETKPYSNLIRKIILLYFGRELSAFEKHLKNKEGDHEDTFYYMLNCCGTVTQIIQTLQKMNKVENSKLPHFPEIFSYTLNALKISYKVKISADTETKLWKKNKESLYYSLCENIDQLSKIYYADENFDYTVGEQFQHLILLKDSDMTELNDIKNEMFESRITQQIADKNSKPSLFSDSGPVIKVRSLVPRIKGFEDDDLDLHEKIEKQKFEKKKLKQKSRKMEKKVVRELTEDTRTLENQRHLYQDKLNVQKEKNYKKLMAECERTQMMLKKEATTNHSMKRKTKKKGKRMAGNKTA